MCSCVWFCFCRYYVMKWKMYNLLDNIYFLNSSVFWLFNIIIPSYHNKLHYFISYSIYRKLGFFFILKRTSLPPVFLSPITPFFFPPFMCKCINVGGHVCHIVLVETREHLLGVSLETELRSLGCVTSALTCWAIPLALSLTFLSRSDNYPVFLLVSSVVWFIGHCCTQLVKLRLLLSVCFAF